MPKPDKVETEEEAIAALEAAGFTNVTDVEQHGATWHANATNSSGQPAKVHIDGAGKVHEHGTEEETKPPEAQPKEE